MEYVPGVPITAYCDQNRVDTRGRLEIFIQACEGIQHAHQKGILHRDIKPSNVLVALQDDKPVPKIIDFGIAKATALPLTDSTLVTELGQMIGTPAYMSPEQAGMVPLDVDTRSDVYSLGVMLYELLAGVLPFDAGAGPRLDLERLRQRIRDEEPSRPSARVSVATEVDTAGPPAGRIRSASGASSAAIWTGSS
jgi:serine/threonine protein kinase